MLLVYSQVFSSTYFALKVRHLFTIVGGRSTTGHVVRWTASLVFGFRQVEERVRDIDVIKRWNGDVRIGGVRQLFYGGELYLSLRVSVMGKAGIVA